MEYHIHGFGALGDNAIVGDSHGSVIVGLDGKLPLGKLHSYDSLANGVPYL